MEWRDIVVMMEGITEDPAATLRRGSGRSGTPIQSDGVPSEKKTYPNLVFVSELFIPHRWKLTHPGAVVVDFRATQRKTKKK